MYRNDPQPGAVGGASTPPAAASPAAPATPAVPPNLTPIPTVQPAAPPPPATPPAPVTPAAPALDAAALLAAFDARLAKVQADNDARMAMHIKTSLMELGIKPPTARPKPAAPPAPAAEPPKAADPAAPPAGNSAPSLETEALKTQLAEMQAQIKAANDQLAAAQKEKQDAAIAAHSRQVRATVEKILTSPQIGMAPMSAAAASEMLIDLRKSVVEDAQQSLWVKFTDDSGKEVTKPLLEGLQAWSNTQIGKVFKPPVPQGSGNGFTERIRDKWNALGRTPAVNPQRSGVDAFMQAVEQQKSGQFGPR